MCKISASHEAGLESMMEIADKLSLKVTHAHNERGVLCLNWKSYPGKYELRTAESLWPLDPVDHYVCGCKFELESDGPNPFNGHAPPFVREKFNRRI
jgi:hypothetical protein